MDLTIEADDDTEFGGEWPGWEPVFVDIGQPEDTVPGELTRKLVRASLFDLASDPGETRDIASEHPKILRDLYDRLDAWEQMFDRPEQGAESIALDQQTLERLRSLGYVK